MYSRRWEVENDFRDLKATLGLDVLRTRIPEMIEREVLMQAIAYNVVCAIMKDSARTHSVPLDRLSFKDTKPRRDMVVSASRDLKK